MIGKVSHDQHLAYQGPDNLTILISFLKNVTIAYKIRIAFGCVSLQYCDSIIIYSNRQDKKVSGVNMYISKWQIH